VRTSQLPGEEDRELPHTALLISLAVKRYSEQKMQSHMGGGKLALGEMRH
jgi:hypothetical protein